MLSYSFTAYDGTRFDEEDDCAFYEVCTELEAYQDYIHFYNEDMKEYSLASSRDFVAAVENFFYVDFYFSEGDDVPNMIKKWLHFELPDMNGYWHYNNGQWFYKVNAHEEK